MMTVSSSSSSSSTERSLLFVEAVPSSPASWHLPSRRLELEPEQPQQRRWRIGAGLLSIATTILLGLLGSVVVMFDLGGRSTVASVTTTTRETTAAAPERTSTTLGSRRHQQDARYADWEHFLAQTSTATSTATAAVVVVSDSEGSAAITTTPPPPLLYFNDSAAFARVTPADDFFHYQNGWEAQRTQALCAIATTDAMLNSLRDTRTTPGDDFQLPIGTIYAPYPWADQHYTIATAPYHNPCVLKAVGGTVPNVEAVSHMGLGLTMVPHLANCFLTHNGYTATGYPALPVTTTTATSSVQQRRMKDRVITALQDPQKRVLLNYDRAGIGQQRVSGGHWSPLGAYHTRTDTFLIMDVAKYKYPMVWVSWEQLWNGAATLDLCSETVPFLTDDTNATTTTTTTNDEEDANFNFTTIDWSLSNRDTIWKYIVTKCRPGHRGFVVIEPTI